MGALRHKRRLAAATAFAVAGLTATAVQSYAAAGPASSAGHQVRVGHEVVAVPVGHRVVPAAENIPTTSALAALNGHVYYSSEGYKIVALPATLARVPTGALAGIEAGFAADAARIGHGAARMTSNGEVVSVTPVGRSQNGLKRYRDVTIASHWWGYELWFDAWATNHLSYGLSGSGVIAVILKEAIGSSWVAAAVIAAVGGYANICKHRDGTTDFIFIGRSTPFAASYCH